MAVGGSATVGNVLVLTYRVKNLGTMAATGVTLNAPLPGGLKVLGVRQSGGTYDKAVKRASIATLAAGGEAVFTVRVRATTAGFYRLTGTVAGTATEDQVGNNRAAALLRVTPPPPPPAAPPTPTTLAWLASMIWR